MCYNVSMANKYPNKRMIYIRPKNLEFYDSIPRKSKLINEFLERLADETDKRQLDIVEEVENLGRDS